MQIIRDIAAGVALPGVRSRALAIGNFDGLHLGHQALIGHMVQQAHVRGLTPCVLTFAPHPKRFFAPNTPVLRISRLRDQYLQLQSLGVQQMLCLRFNQQLASMSADGFITQILKQALRAEYVLSGEDFRFGAGRVGDAQTLKQAFGANAEALPMRIAETVDALNGAYGAHGVYYSSTGVRAALKAGDMALAASLLGRPFSSYGRVMHGDARGRTLGVPTANIAYPSMVLPPLYGVYQVQVRSSADGVWTKPRPAVANFGLRPTFSHASSQPLLEVHVLEESGNYYGQCWQVQWLRLLRPEQRFDSLEAIKQQLQADLATARLLHMLPLTSNQQALCYEPYTITH